MADCHKLISHILKWEGEWSDRPTDKGGPTMKGVTLTTYKKFRKDRGLPEPTKQDLKNITDQEWFDIFKYYYWDWWKADQIIDQSIANILVDWVYNSGVSGIKNPQGILGVIQDGIVGVNTLNAINYHPSYPGLFSELWNARKEFYEIIVERTPSQKEYFKGWMNRLNDIRYEQG